MFVGDLAQMVLDGADLAALPGTREALAAALNRDGWAVVGATPTPPTACTCACSRNRSAESLGKFYNGTPLSVLGQEGDWTRVALGLDGAGGMDDDALSGLWQRDGWVEPVFPHLMYVLELEDRQPAYSAPREGAEKELAGAISVVGRRRGRVLHPPDRPGRCGYVPQSWLWEGNG